MLETHRRHVSGLVWGRALQKAIQKREVLLKNCVSMLRRRTLKPLQKGHAWKRNRELFISKDRSTVGPPERLELRTVMCVILCVFGEREYTLNRNTLFYKTRSASNVSRFFVSLNARISFPKLPKSECHSFFLGSLHWLSRILGSCSPGDMLEIPGSQSMPGSLLWPHVQTNWIPVAPSPYPSLLKDFC